MKHYSSFFFLFILLLFSRCKKIDKLLTFNFNKSHVITVPQIAIIPYLTISSDPVIITNDAKQEFIKQNTAAELVKDVSLSNITLHLESPTGEDFGFLKDIELFLSADNAPEVSVAYLRDIPANAGNVLTLTSTNIKLDKYLKANTFLLRTKGTADEPVTNDITVRVDMVFKVTADPL